MSHADKLAWPYGECCDIELRENNMLKKRLLTCTLTLVMASAMAFISAGQASAEEEKPEGTILSPEEYGYGYIPVDIDVYDVPQRKNAPGLLRETAEAELPSAYRSDKEVWAQNIKIRDQKRTSLCWAFSGCTAAEYSYAKEVYEETGEIIDMEEAPGHLGQFYYHRVDDPLGNTSGDSNGISSGENWALLGGNLIVGMQHMSTWSGLVSEERAPFSETNQHVTSDYIWEGPEEVYPTEIAYGNNDMVLQESIFIKKIDRDSLKQLILKYGAVSSSMDFNYRKYMNLDETDPETGEKYYIGRSYYNYKDSYSADHAVTIVGWDDNYPKENFAHDIAPEKDENGNETVYSHEESIEMTTPENDGAWIVQNSWGDYVHEGGILYVSYENVDFRSENYFFVFDMQSPDAYKYNFLYDGTAGCADITDLKDGEAVPFRTLPGTRAANVFTNTTGEPVSIDAVGFTTYNNGLSYYDVSVYTDLKDPEDPCSGICHGTTRISSVYVGCKTAELDSEVTVLPGETFSIVFSFDEFNAFGIEESIELTYTYFEAEIQPGQSFFCGENSEEWTDMSDYEACYRIKAFANPAKDVTKAPSAEELIYNGEDQELVSGAEAVDLTVVYTLGENETEAPETGYSAEVPTGKDAGTYYVWYRVTEADGTAVSKPRCVAAAIAEKPVSITAKDQTVSYKGSIAQGVNMVDVSGILEGHRLEGIMLDSDSTSIVTSGGTITPSDALIMAGDADVTDNYDITYETGVLTVRENSIPLSVDPPKKGEDEKGGKTEEEGEKKPDPDKPEEPTVQYSSEWVEGKWYNRDGTQTYKPKGGWKTDKKGTYYIDSAGWYPRNRWQRIDGKSYYFDRYGYMERNAYRNGWYMGSDGVWDGKKKADGWRQYSGGWRYFTADGIPLADGWQNIDGSCYYFNTEGYAVQGEYVQGWWLDKKSCRQVYPYMAAWHKNIRGWWYGDSSGWYAKKGTYIIDGVRYTFDAEGYLAE